MTTEAQGGAPAAIEGQPGAEGTPAEVVAPVVNGDPLSLDGEAAAPKEGAKEPGTAPVVYDATGDVGLDLALDFVGNLGFGPDHPAIQAAESGDFAAIREELSKLGVKAKGFEKFIALAEKSYKDSLASHTEKASKDVAAIESAVGGKEAWETVRVWARAQTEDSPSQRAEVNAALKQGGMVAVAMAKHLTHLYNKSGQATQEPAPVTQPGAAGKPAAAGPLTAKEFGIQTQALRNKLGYNFESSQEYQVLQARRVSARRAGY